MWPGFERRTRKLRRVRGQETLFSQCLILSIQDKKQNNTGELSEASLQNAEGGGERGWGGGFL